MKTKQFLIFFLFIISAFCALHFKEGNAGAGNNYVSHAKNVLQGSETDNSICHSQSLIGLVDGESPVLPNIKITAKYLSNIVSKRIFFDYFVDFHKYSLTTDQRDEQTILKELSKLLQQGIIKGTNEVRDIIVESSTDLFNKLIRNVPDWRTIFDNQMDSIERAQAKQESLFDSLQTGNIPGIVMPSNTLQEIKNSKIASSPKSGQENNKPQKMDRHDLFAPENGMSLRKNIVKKQTNNFVKKLKKFADKVVRTSKNYLSQIDDFKLKINSGVAVTVVTVSNNLDYNRRITDKAKSFLNFYFNPVPNSYSPQRATINGIQHGQSFVANFGRKEIKINGQKYFVHEIKDYSISSHNDLMTIFPELTPLKNQPFQRLKKFSYDVQETDVILVADATLIENLSITFINYLMNYGLYKLHKKALQNKEWVPVSDDFLKLQVDLYIAKMSSPNTINHAFKIISKNQNFANINEDSNGIGLQKCGLSAFFPTIYTKYDSFISFFSNFGRKECLDNLVKDQFAIPGESIADSSDDFLVSAFKAHKISDMFSLVLQWVQNALHVENKIIEATPTQFLSFKMVRFWKDLKILEDEQNDTRLREVTVEGLETAMKKGLFEPIQGDLSIFTNILVKGFTLEDELLCSFIDDSEAKNLPKLLKEFFTKSTGLKIISQNNPLSEDQISVIDVVLGNEEFEEEKQNLII